MSNKLNIMPVGDHEYLPHQKSLIEKIISTPRPYRLVVSSPSGSGVSYAIAGAAGILRAQKRQLRCIVITASKDAAMWQHLLGQFAGLEASLMNPQTYMRIKASSGVRSTVWTALQCVVLPLEFLDKNERVNDLLGSKWDFAVLDGADICSVRSPRGEAAMLVWRKLKTSIGVAISPTPDGSNILRWNSDIKEISWKASALLSASQRRKLVLPRRRSHILEYQPSKGSKKAALLIKTLLKSKQKAISSERAKQAVMLLTHRLESSMYAGEHLLRKALALDEIVEWTDVRKSDDEAYDDISVLRYLRESASERFIESLIAMLENERADNKLTCLFEFFIKSTIGSKKQGIVMTEYSDTAEYLEFMVKNKGHSVFLITHSVSPEQKMRILDEAKKSPSVLIGTDALTELEIRYANMLVHYDLPLRPEALHKRFRAIESFGHPHFTIDNYFVLERGPKSNIKLEEALKEVEAIDKEWW